MLEANIHAYYIGSQERRDQYLQQIERVVLKTDSYHQDQETVSVTDWRNKAYREPLSGEWSADRFLYMGVDENQKRYFGKQFIRIESDITKEKMIEYHAQLLLLLTDMKETPNLIGWWEDTIIMTLVPGATIRGAYFNGWLTTDWLSDHLPRIVSVVGRVRDRLLGYEVYYDCSITNVLITYGGQVHLVDFDPANRPTDILTFAGLLINLATGSMIFNSEGKLVYAEGKKDGNV